MEITDFSKGKIWSIIPSHLEEMLKQYREIRGSDALAARLARFTEDPQEPDDFMLRDGVAIIPVTGPIFKRGSFWSFLYGGTPLTVLSRIFMDALEDRDVQAIVLDIDSPGGTVSGTEAFGDLVFNSRGTKPVVAFGNGMMASAAYWIGSGADRVVVESTADVGSIGVLMVHFDWSKEDEMMGLKRTFLTAGKYKALGNDAEPLSDLARKTFQDELDYIYSIFVNTVARNRGTDPEAVLRDMADGRIFIGRQAVDAGLADAVGSLDTAIETAQSLIEARRPAIISSPYAGASASGKETSTMNDNITTVEQLEQAYPDLTARIRQDARNDVDLPAARDEAAAAERDRVLGLAAIQFGAEAGETFRSVVETGVTVEQFQAIRQAAAPAEPAEPAEASAVNKAKEEMLQAIHDAAPENPGAGSGAGDTPEDFAQAWRSVKAEKGCTTEQAMRTAAARWPDLHQAYLDSHN